MCFGCSKKPSYRGGSFEYPQHWFWLRNNKNNFQFHTLIEGPDTDGFADLNPAKQSGYSMELASTQFLSRLNICHIFNQQAELDIQITIPKFFM